MAFNYQKNYEKTSSGNEKKKYKQHELFLINILLFRIESVVSLLTKVIQVTYTKQGHQPVN